MTRERSSAYGRVMTLMGSFGSDLLPEEREQIRAAADALLFCPGPEPDSDARHALDVARDLVVRRVISGCALNAVADRLLVELASCGPDSQSIGRAA